MDRNSEKWFMEHRKEIAAGTLDPRVCCANFDSNCFFCPPVCPVFKLRIRKEEAPRP